MTEHTQSHNCNKHFKKIEVFCKSHDCPCCTRCVIECHQQCPDLPPIEDVVRDLNMSKLFDNVEKQFEESGKIFKDMLVNRQENFKTLKAKRRDIEKEILDIRNTINCHLDRLQEYITEKVKIEEKNMATSINNILKILQKREREVQEHKETLNTLKKKTSNTAIFVALKQEENWIHENKHFLREQMENNNLNESTINLVIDKTLKDFKRLVPAFGQVNLETKPTLLLYESQSKRGAQMIVPKSRNKSTEKISLDIEQKIVLQAFDIRGCSILPDQNFAFSCHEYPGIIKIVNADGTIDSEIRVKEATSCDISYVPETDNLVATSGGGGNKCISLIDLKTRKVKDYITMQSYNDGVCVSQGRLIFCAREKGIQMMNLKCGTISYISKNIMSNFAYVATFRDNIYYTNKDTNKVTCCNFQGKIQWEFHDESVLKCPLGIDADNNGNVFVVGQDSSNVVVISKDGKQHWQVLTRKDGLNKPSVLHFDRLSNNLLIANHDRSAIMLKSL